MNSYRRLIFGLVLVCMAGVSLADDAPPAWVNVVDMNAMERVLLNTRIMREV